MSEKLTEIEKEELERYGGIWKEGKWISKEAIK